MVDSSGISVVDEKHSLPIEPEALGETTIEQNGMKTHPQPASDPLDPLNWSTLEKHTILGIVMLKSVCHFPSPL